MPYYKGKQFKINIYTLFNTQWTDRFGNPAPIVETNVPNMNTFPIITGRLKEILQKTAENTLTSIRVFPPKIVPGFIPTMGANGDTVNNFLAPYGDLSPVPTNPGYQYDPLQFNTTFCCGLPSADQNAPQSRKGTKITLSSIYIVGSVTKSQIPLRTSTATVLNQYDPVQSQEKKSQLLNNQVTYYLIYQQCRNPGEGVPNWRDIFYLNGSNKCSVTNPEISNPLTNNCINPEGTSYENIFGYTRFTHPELNLTVNNKEKFVILSTVTLDLDSENTQFNFKLYEKLKVALPQSTSKKKNPIQVTYKNTGSSSLLTDVESGALYLVRASYGVYNDLLQSAGAIKGTGTVEGSDTAYTDLARVYPSESLSIKVNYLDM
jgi:hypothetical protein